MRRPALLEPRSDSARDAGLALAWASRLKRYQHRRVGLLQPLQTAFALYDVLVVPLNCDRLFEPAVQVLRSDLIFRGVARFGGLESTLGCKVRLVERLAAPEKQTNAILEFVIADDRIA